jgi:hypothetical protein
MRFCKCALLVIAGQSEQTGQGVPVAQAQTSMQAAQQEFEAALTYLNGLPLSTPAIYDTLGAAGVAWLQVVAAAKEAQRLDAIEALETLANGSETLLRLFDQLSAHYERSMQLLVG